MNVVLRKILSTFLGMALVLGFWTVQGKCNGSRSEPVAAKIPSKVWEGGGGKCKLEVEVSDPTEVWLEFYAWGEKGAHHADHLNARETVPAGRHTFIVEVPPETNVSPELHMVKPVKAGAKMAWALTCGEKEMYRGEETFDGNGDEFWIEGETIANAGTGADE